MSEKISLIEPRIRIIAFRGKKGSGKTTASEVLNFNNEECFRIEFAGPMKDFMVSVMGLPWSTVWGDDKAKQFITQYRWEDMPYRDEYTNICYCRGVSPKYGFMTVREMLQYWGTEVFRRIDPSIHLKAYLKAVKRLGGGCLVRTSDVRYVNEAKLVLGLNPHNLLITIERLGWDNTDQHPSEISLDNFVHPRHFKIVNDGTVEQLHKKVRDLVLDRSLVCS